MMRRLRLTTIVVAAAVCLAASHASNGGEQVQGSREDVEAIKKIIMQMTDGMNRKNAATMSIRVCVKSDDKWRVTAFHNTMVREAGQK